jgi:hypothetical protein
MLRQRRSERRWRIGFRLAWFGLVLAVAWAVFTQHGVHPAAPSGPHTALIEVRGEIAEQSEASAENIVASLKSAYEDDSAKGIVMRFNSPGGSPVQAGIVSDEIQRLRKLHPNKKLYAVVRGDVRLGGLLHGRQRRRDLRRQGQHRRLHRRADGRLRLHRPDGQAGRGAPPADRRRQQGHAGPVLAGGREAEGLRRGHAGTDPPAVHHRGQARPG